MKSVTAAPAGPPAAPGTLARLAPLGMVTVLVGLVAMASVDAVTPKEEVATGTSLATAEGGLATASSAATATPMTLTVPSGDVHLLAALRVTAEIDPGGYDRVAFAYPGGGTDTRGCDTRARVLQRDSTVPVQVESSGCKVVAGRWVDSSTGTTYERAADVSIDHVVALKEAYVSGASSWSAATLSAFGNDVDRVEALQVIGGSGNASKGDKDPAEWRPPLRSSWPGYARSWLVVKVAYGLTADQAEAEALREMLAPPTPPSSTPPAAPTVAPAPSATQPRAITPTPPSTKRSPAPSRTPTPSPSPCHPSYRGACLPVDAADVDCQGGRGNGPVYTGTVQVIGPDVYDLDADGDGVGCE